MVSLVNFNHPITYWFGRARSVDGNPSLGQEYWSVSRHCRSTMRSWATVKLSLLHFQYTAVASLLCLKHLIDRLTCRMCMWSCTRFMWEAWQGLCISPGGNPSLHTSHEIVCLTLWWSLPGRSAIYKEMQCKKECNVKGWLGVDLIQGLQHGEAVWPSIGISHSWCSHRTHKTTGVLPSHASQMMLNYAMQMQNHLCFQGVLMHLDWLTYDNWWHCMAASVLMLLPEGVMLANTLGLHDCIRAPYMWPWAHVSVIHSWWQVQGGS